MAISNEHIADRLSQTAFLLNRAGVDPGRASAFEKAATALRTAPEPLEARIRNGANLTNVLGINAAAVAAIRWIVEKETLPLRAELARTELATSEEGGHATERGGSPRLVRDQDLRGSLHMHTTYSDGLATLQEMVEGARARGYEYVAITDHGEHLMRRGDLHERRLNDQAACITALRSRYDDVRIYHGAEVDVLEDGTLDLPDRALAELDLCIASVHTAYELPADVQTARILRALGDPRVHILGHPMGRHIGKRPPMQVDVDRIVEAAIENDVCLEINGKSYRMDLPVRYIRQAAQAGGVFVISSDAHAVRDHDRLGHAVRQARQGGLVAGDILNTRPAAAIAHWLGSRSLDLHEDAPS